MSEQQFPPHATYDQRYGDAPLPEAMKPGEISPDLRREILDLLVAIIHRNIPSGYTYTLEQNFSNIIQKVVGEFACKPRHSVDTSADKVVSYFERVLKLDSHDVLKFLELFFDSYPRLVEPMSKILERYVAPYTLIKSEGYTRFHPISLEAERQSIAKSFAVLDKHGYYGASKHLTDATESMNKGNYADCIRDSIHAVESVTKRITGKENKTLGDALKSLEKNGIKIHPALKGGFLKLYGFTNDEEGIRHSLIEKDKAVVDERIAMFMYGACASFAAYLVGQSRKEDNED